MIEETLKLIEKHTGLSLTLCDHFKGIFEHQGKQYFNVVFEDRLSLSEQFSKLEEFAISSNLISVEANGLSRAAVFVKTYKDPLPKDVDTETVTIARSGDNYELIIQHDQTGSAYGIKLSQSAYAQLREHFTNA